MLVVGALMLRKRASHDDIAVTLTRDNFPMLAVLGLCTGALSGFFGIGGGFLIVPALMRATGMPILNAIGSSLVAVTAFGLTTAASYALSGFVDWPLALLFVTGGVVGGLLGARLAKSLSSKRTALNNVFAGLIFAVSIYMIMRSSIIIRSPVDRCKRGLLSPRTRSAKPSSFHLNTRSRRGCHPFPS
jgi:uncharacterized protein